MVTLLENTLSSSVRLFQLVHTHIGWSLSSKACVSRLLVSGAGESGYRSNPVEIEAKSRYPYGKSVNVKSRYRKTCISVNSVSGYRLLIQVPNISVVAICLLLLFFFCFCFFLYVLLLLFACCHSISIICYNICFILLLFVEIKDWACVPCTTVDKNKNSIICPDAFDDFLILWYNASFLRIKSVRSSKFVFKFQSSVRPVYNIH